MRMLPRKKLIAIIKKELVVLGWKYQHGVGNSQSRSYKKDNLLLIEEAKPFNMGRVSEVTVSIRSQLPAENQQRK